MNSFEASINTLCRRLVALSELQYRLVLIGVFGCGMVALYQCLSLCIVGLVGDTPSSSQQIHDLFMQRETLRGELLGLERRLARYRSDQDKDALQVGAGREDVVHVIDRAARDASVRVIDLVTAGVSGESRYSYQLSISGGYRGVVEFIAGLVDRHSPIVISEVAIHAAGWMYPSQPLEARLMLEVHSAAKKSLTPEKHPPDAS